jgi:hypothetical protein
MTVHEELKDNLGFREHVKLYYGLVQFVPLPSTCGHLGPVLQSELRLVSFWVNNIVELKEVPASPKVATVRTSMQSGMVCTGNETAHHLVVTVLRLLVGRAREFGSTPRFTTHDDANRGMSPLSFS